MADFELRAEKNRLTLTQKSLLTSGSVNVYSVRFKFSPDWDGLDKRCVFRTGYDTGNVIAVEPDADGVCNIPWEVLTTPDKLLYAGVYGTRGEEIVLPTVWALLGKILQGTYPGEGSGPPTPDAWQQLKDDLARAAEELENIQGYSAAAGESAERAGGYADAAEGSARGAATSASEAERQAGFAASGAGSATRSAQAADASRKSAQTAQTGAESARDTAKEYRDQAGENASQAARSADTAKQYSSKPPTIENGTWWTWDAEKQDYVDTGDPANLNPRGEYAPEAVYNRQDVVRRSGSSYLALKDGLTGVLPIDGEDWMCLVERSGKSAYEQAVDAGLTATEAEFSSALARAVTAFGDWTSGLTPEEEIDPEIVYERTRPVDWMKMPALEDVQDGEFWLLFQWLPGDTAECSFAMQAKTDIKVEAGRYENGAFTPDEKYTKDYHPANANANTTVSISLDSDDFGDTTSVGKVQAMVKISGDITYIRCNAADYWCADGIINAGNLSHLETIFAGLLYFAIVNMSTYDQTISFGSNLYRIPMLAVRGGAAWFNNLGSAPSLFQRCSSLIAIPPDFTMADVLDTGAGVYGGMFRDCYSLRELPPGATFEISINGVNMFNSCYTLRELPPGVTFANLVNGNSMFYNCYTLRELPPGVTFANLVNGQNMFYSCYTLRELPSTSFPAATNLQSLFQNSGIRRVKDLYIPNCTNLTNAFSGCSSLEELTFDQRMTTWETPQDIALNGTALTHAAIVNLFNSLPTITTAKTITLTSNPGASEVTAEDVAIATAKGWKVAGVPAATASDPGLEGPEIFTDGQAQGEPYFIDRYGNEYYGPFYKS